MVSGQRLSNINVTLRAGLRLTAACALIAGCCAAWGQAIIIGDKTGAPVDRRYAQIQSTSVALPKEPIDARGHQEIYRSLTAEQGFAMRPLPRGKKGLTLVANGKLSPAGESYLSMVTEQGLSVKPGDRAVLTNIRIDHDRLVFDINGGPERKHEFLRHIQIGVGGPGMTPAVQGQDNEDPSGSRITLTFANHVVPNLTPAQIKSLLSPLISFDVKTPVQAYTDTLPPTLKSAILEHHVLVGMSTDMVLFALGQPEKKSREVEGQMPFEEWIYGHPPQDVNFVRINGNRVIRVEVAKLGQPLEIFTHDEVAGLMTTDGKSVLDAEVHEVHPVQLGDVHRDPDTQAPAAPPTLRNPGEKLPSDDPNRTIQSREGPMKPVIFPKDTTNDPAHTTAAKPDATQMTAPQPQAAQTGGAKPALGNSGATPDKPAAAPDKPAAAPAPPAPAQTPPPASNFYADWPRPAMM